MPPWRCDRPPGPDRRRGQRLPGREDGRVEALRLAPVRLALEDQVREDEAGDVVEHQRGEDLVRLEERAQDARDQRPQRCRRCSPPRPSPRSRTPTGRRGRRSRGPPRRPVIAPMYICPSAPMLKSLIRNAAAAASPVNASGVAAISVWSSEPVERNAASKSWRYVDSGLCPVARSTSRGHEEREDDRARPAPRP